MSSGNDPVEDILDNERVKELSKELSKLKHEEKVLTDNIKCIEEISNKRLELLEEIINMDSNVDSF